MYILSFILCDYLNSETETEYEILKEFFNKRLLEISSRRKRRYKTDKYII